MTGNPDIIQLRQLLLGKDYEDLLRIKAQFENSERYSEHVADVIAEALTLRTQKDDALTAALNPVIEQSLHDTIQNDPKRLADVLYPVMGPAIRKSINQSLSDTLSHFNQMLEQSLSLQALRWRYDAWRTGQSYAQVVMMQTLIYQVEQVFLIHRESGLLIEHLVSDQAISKDPDMVSGMLTAIQDFVKDSFDVAQDDQLSTLKLGELTVLVEHSPHAVIALVVRGIVPGKLHTQLRETSEQVHQKYGRLCRDFTGDTTAFAGIDDSLRPCLMSQKQADQAQTDTEHPNSQRHKRKPWLLYGVLFALCSAIAGWLWHNHQQNRAAEQAQQQRQHLLLSTQQRLHAEPGIALLTTEETASGYHLKGLIDPHARLPDTLISEATRQQLGLSFDFTPYLSMDEAILPERVLKTLQAPAGVQLSLQGRTLHISGDSDEQWYRYVQQAWSLIPGLDGINTEQLTPVDTAKRQQAKQQEQQQRLYAALQRDIQQLESRQYLFETAQTGIDASRSDLQQSITTMKSILLQARNLQKQVQITLIGHSDTNGTPEKNQVLAQQRALQMRDTLIKQGIPANLLQAYGEHDSGAPADIRRDERSVSYRIQLF